VIRGSLIRVDKKIEIAPQVIQRFVARSLPFSPSNDVMGLLPHLVGRRLLVVGWIGLGARPAFYKPFIKLVVQLGMRDEAQYDPSSPADITVAVDVRGPQLQTILAKSVHVPAPFLHSFMWRHLHV
jgi:hypothetical protein